MIDIAVLHAVIDARVEARMRELGRRADGYLNVGSAAAYCDMTPAAIRSAIQRGDIPACRPYGNGKSGRVFLKRSDLDAFMAGEAA